MALIAILFIALITHFNTALPAHKIYNICPNLKASLVNMGNQNHHGKSQTCDHVQRLVEKNKYNQNDLNNYIAQNVTAFQSAPHNFSPLILKAINLEKELATSHHVFYHGTRATTLILLNTALKQLKEKQTFQDFFILRNPNTTTHLNQYQSGYAYATHKIKSIYTEHKGLDRFDNNQPMRSDLLSVNTVLLNDARGIGNEDSISFMGNTRLGPSHLKDSIDTCLKNYKLTNLPPALTNFLYTRIGGIIIISIPKNLTNLAYLSHSFGIPFGLPSDELLTGKMPVSYMHTTLRDHKALPLDYHHAQASKYFYPQARVLLKPNYFDTYPSPIKMQLFMWQSPQNMQYIQTNLNAIKSFASEKVTGKSNHLTE